MKPHSLYTGLLYAALATPAWAADLPSEGTASQAPLMPLCKPAITAQYVGDTKAALSQLGEVADHYAMAATAAEQYDMVTAVAHFAEGAAHVGRAIDTYESALSVVKDAACKLSGADARDVTARMKLGLQAAKSTTEALEVLIKSIPLVPPPTTPTVPMRSA